MMPQTKTQKERRRRTARKRFLQARNGKNGIDFVPAARDVGSGTGEFSGWDGEILMVGVNPCDLHKLFIFDNTPKSTI